MKTLYRPLIASALLFVSAPLYAQFAGGAGTEANPYQIAGVEQLQAMKDHLDKHFVLVNDIDASATASWNPDAGDFLGFEPVGDEESPFTGSLDGAGFVITDLTINRPDRNLVGLFGWADQNAAIMNLGLAGGSITGFNGVGAIAGRLGHEHTDSGATIANSFSTTKIAGNATLGGLTGWNNGTITNSYASGSVTGAETGIGGLTGIIFQGVIENSYATGNVEGDDHVAGLAGLNWGGAVSHSYAAGRVTGNSSVTGLTIPISGGTITSSYFNTQTTGQGQDFGIGVNSDEMRRQETFDGWDFENTWDIMETQSFPFLRSNSENPPPGFFINPFTSGDGSAENPYQIENVDQLQAVNELLTSHFVLANHIDATSTAAWNEDNGQFLGFEPIGDFDSPFDGLIDGAGFVITGLTINRPSQNLLGLIGVLSTGGEVINLGLEGVNIGGAFEVGGIAGRNNGSIKTSYTTGNIEGISDVGGLAGNNGENGSIVNSYSTAGVEGHSRVGGLAGALSIFGSIVNSYAAGSVTGVESPGGLVAFSEGGSITNSFWNTETSGQSTSAGGTGLTSTQMRRQNSFNGWDFDEIWSISEALSFPVLQENSQNPPPGLLFTTGSGTGADPFHILTAEQLNGVRDFLDAHFTLTGNIDLDVFPWNEEGWMPIGSDPDPFTGSLDGDGFSVTGLYIIHSGSDHIGLFGRIDGAEIKNIGLVDVDIVNFTGREQVGGLAGRIDNSTISNSFSTGSVAGGSEVGGLVGRSNNSTTTGSFSSASVTGASFVGGLVGMNSGSSTVSTSYSTGSAFGSFSVGGLAGNNSSSSIIDNSYSTASVTGSTVAGGLTGENFNATISNSYSIGSVSGDAEVGGLAGSNNTGAINSFWNTVTSGQSESAGGTGLTGSQMRLQNSFTDWDFEDVWSIDEGMSFPVLRENLQSPPPGQAFASGSGTAEDPFRIATAEQLDAVRDFQDAHFILTGHIDLGTAPWNEGEGWMPIGTQFNPFTGSLNGNGFTISGLFISRAGTVFVGLFGSAVNADLTNIGLVDVNITGGSYVGALAGLNSGTVTNCFSTGSVNGSDKVGGLIGENDEFTISNSHSTASVTGSGQSVGGFVGTNNSGAAITNSYSTGTVIGSGLNVGGLAGANIDGSLITNSYSTGNVSGGSRVGGLAGRNDDSIISNSYATGSVSADGNDVGGLAGENPGGTILNSFASGRVTGDGEGIGGLAGSGGSVTNSFWNIITGGPDNGIGTGLTGSQMRRQISFSGWDFNGTWSINEAMSYPFLQDNPQTPPPGLIFITGGSGTAEDPFEIATAGQLNDIREFPDAHFILTADINLGESPWHDGEGWLPVGDSPIPFSGSLDGNEFTITGLFIDRGTVNDVGLFGRLNGAELKNIRLIDVNVTGDFRVGALAGRSANSAITNSYSTGIVKGDDSVGGLVGQSRDGSTISGSYSTANVSGSNEVGGLVGVNRSSSTVTNSYSAGSVSGSFALGGLVGENFEADISSSYSTGEVENSDESGGLVGVNDGGTISNSYWNTGTSGQPGSDGGTGLDDGAFHQQASFDGFDFASVWTMLEGVSWPVLRDNLQLPLPFTLLPAGVVLTATENHTPYSFDGTRISLQFTGIGEGDVLLLYAEFDESPPQNIAFASGAAASHGPFRWLVQHGGAGFAGAMLTIHGVSALHNIPDPAAVDIYRRSTAGSGGFSRLTTDYDSGADALSAALDGFGEFMLGSVASSAFSHRALQLDGSDQFVEIAHDASLSLTTNYTIEAWIRPESFSFLAGVVSKWQEQGNSYLLRLTASSPFTGIGFDGMETANGILEAGKWYHLAAVNSSGSRTLYVNGETVALSGSAVTVQHNTDPVTIGVDFLSSPRYFDGLIDDLRLWNVARTADEIRAGMHRELTGSESGLAGYWKMNEGAGSLVTDATANGNHGTYNGGWIASTAPLGAGSSVSVAGLQSGEHDLGMLTLKLSEDFDSPVDITATQITGSPNQLPDDELIWLDDRYWVVGVFGDPGTFSADLTFTVPPAFTESGATSPVNYRLFRRPGNSDGDWETAVDRASAVTETSVTFEGITSFSQFVLGKSDPLTLEIAGSEGWRMLSSPGPDFTYASLLDGLWTQGFTGASFEGGSPNVYNWNEAAREFEPVPGAADIPEPGAGYIAWIYRDDVPGQTGSFPKTVTLHGATHAGEITPPVSLTLSGGGGTFSADTDGWNLVGNPYSQTIDWDAASGWTKTGLDNVIYIWNPAAGEYQSWNGAAGTLANEGLIAPFQGFWVKANNTEAPVLTLDDNTRSTGGQFLKKTPVPQLSLQLEGRGKSSRTVVMLHSEADADKDPFDAWKLHSLNEGYLSLFTVSENGAALDINALPSGLDRVLETPLGMNGSDLAGELSLAWSPHHLPGDWAFELIDAHTGQTHSLNESGSLRFEYEAGNAQKKRETAEAVGVAPDHCVFSPRVVKARAAAHQRFVIRITPGSALSEEPDPALPDVIAMHQNFPNPFNPSTVIRYQLPVSSEVRLDVFDMLGRRVATLINGRVEAGFHEINFNAAHLASGVYVYRLDAGGQSLTRRMTLIK